MTRAQSYLFSYSQLVFVLEIFRDGGSFIVAESMLQNDELDDEGRGGEMRIAKADQLVSQKAEVQS